jgi:hypothetical protein
MADLPANVPDAVRDCWDNFHGLTVPPNLPKAVEAVYVKGSEGYCMTCKAPVGEEALLVVNITGINQIYCSHKCNQDINVTGWLAQQHDDLREAIEFRGSDRS